MKNLHSIIIVILCAITLMLMFGMYTFNIAYYPPVLNEKNLPFFQTFLEKHEDTDDETPSAAIEISSPKTTPCEGDEKKVEDIFSYKWSSDDHFLMKKMYENQFPESCDGKRFIVYNLGGLKSRNIGSVTTQITHWLAEAIYSKRILIWGPEDWDQAHCEEKTWECYFKPISSCTYKDIPDEVDIIQVPKGGFEHISEEGDIIAFFATVAWWRMNNGEIEQFLKIKPEIFHAYAFTYFLRLNDQYKTIVESNIKVLMEKYPNIDTEKTVSMPIRGSDKCIGHNMTDSSPGEDDCFPISTYISALDKYRCQHYECDPKQLTNIIVTSEDEKMVYKATDLGEKSRWNVVINEFDVMQGTGSANALQSIKSKTKNSEVIISVFTSLQLQLRGKYYVKKRHMTARYSNWIFIIEEILTRVGEATFGGDFDPLHIIKLY